MPIERETAVVIPARTEVVAPLEWIAAFSLQAGAGPSGECSAVLESIPMTADGVLVRKDADGRLLTETVTLDGCVFECCRDVPEARALMDALLAAKQPVQAWLRQRAAQTEQ